MTTRKLQSDSREQPARLRRRWNFSQTKWRLVKTYEKYLPMPFLCAFAPLRAAPPNRKASRNGAEAKKGTKGGEGVETLI